MEQLDGVIPEIGIWQPPILFRETLLLVDGFPEGRRPQWVTVYQFEGHPKLGPPFFGVGDYVVDLHNVRMVQRLHHLKFLPGLVAWVSELGSNFLDVDTFHSLEGY